MVATRTRVAVTSQRAKPVATEGTTLHLVGDVHAGASPQWRLDALVRDTLNSRLPLPAARLQLGDGTDNGRDAEHATFEAFRAALGANNIPSLAIMGNHDVFEQTPTQWAARFGYTSQNYTQDFANFRLIVVGSSNMGNDYTVWTKLSAATLTWLDQQLSDAGATPCVIACHMPLWDTVGGSPTLEFTSTAQGFFVNSDAVTTSSQSIIDVLSAHANVKVWLSGHTHSHIEVPGLVMPVMAGSRRLAHVNASCIFYCGQAGAKPGAAGGATDPLHSLFFTFYGDHAEVRFRGHGAGAWIGPQGQRMLAVSGL